MPGRPTCAGRPQPSTIPTPCRSRKASRSADKEELTRSALRKLLARKHADNHSVISVSNLSFSGASGHRIRRRWRIGRQRYEFLVVEIRQLHAARAPICLRLLDALARRRDKIPLDEALADRLASKEHHRRRRRCFHGRSLARLEHKKLARAIGLTVGFDAP